MQPEEYLALKWSDIDFEKHTATVQRVLILRKGGDCCQNTMANGIPFINALPIGLKQAALKDCSSKCPKTAIWNIC